MSNRTHCIVWSDWATQAKVERSHGIRFDTNYYYMGPTAWLRKPGLMTGSGFPQRFADLDGTMIDVYQAMTQVTDEANETSCRPRRRSTRCSTTRSARRTTGASSRSSCTPTTATTGD